jgi:hypothetical protein
MTEQGEEGKAPQAPGGPPPRPTVRENLRRGLFVRLPTEGESSEGVGGAEQPAEGYEQYGEVPAEEYEGWRQTADGGWEPVNAEAYSYSEGYDPTPAEAYPEIDDSANYASVAGGEPFHAEDEEGWSFAGGQAPAAEAEVVEYQETYAEEAAVAEVEVTEPEPAPVEEAPPAEAAPQPATVQATPRMPEDPVAAAGVYIPADVELLEGDMPVYGEKENVPPIFVGEGLGEPLFVEFGDLAKMLLGLRRLLPKGTRLTYNYDYERAWVRASAEVDLPSFAERVRTIVWEE